MKGFVASGFVFVSLALLVLIYEGHRQNSKLQIRISLPRSQELAPYQYNYNRPESIPTLPASSDASYTVSPDVSSSIDFLGR